MSAPKSPASTVLEALGFALFLRDDSGTLRLHGPPPPWLSTLWPGLTNADEALPLTEASPFLENFLIDAEECWAAGGSARIPSGPWVEQSSDGVEVSLEAIALTINGQAALLLERLSEVFEAKKNMLQKARETAIAYQRLNSETQKKEILLSCVAEEMNAALANAITALRLIEMEKQSPRAQHLLGLALRATEDQQTLINKVLDLFSAELEDLYGHGPGTDDSLGEVLRRVQETVMDSFTEKRVQLQLPNENKTNFHLAIDAKQLARVIVSLLENALHNVSKSGTVSLEAIEEAETVLLRVSDNGAALHASVGANLFSRDAIGVNEASALQLPLQFCRMTVEKHQGEFGYEPAGEGSNCFWIRLPKAAASPA